MDGNIKIRIEVKDEDSGTVQAMGENDFMDVDEAKRWAVWALDYMTRE